MEARLEADAVRDAHGDNRVPNVLKKLAWFLSCQMKLLNSLACLICMDFNVSE